MRYLELVNKLLGLAKLALKIYLKLSRWQIEVEDEAKC